MEQINPAQAQRVWNRVRGPEPEGETLARLLALEAECRQICQYLQRNTHLRDSRGLGRLMEESRRFFHILSGMALAAEEDVTVIAPPSVRGNAVGLLRQCLITRRRSITFVDSLSPERFPGTVLLKREMEQNCLTILELLGQLPRK